MRRHGIALLLLLSLLCPGLRAEADTPFSKPPRFGTFAQGWMHYHEGRFGAACEAFEKVYRLDTRFRPALQALQACLEQATLKLPAEALHEYEKEAFRRLEPAPVQAAGKLFWGLQIEQEEQHKVLDLEDFEQALLQAISEQGWQLRKLRQNEEGFVAGEQNLLLRLKIRGPERRLELYRMDGLDLHSSRRVVLIHRKETKRAAYRIVVDNRVLGEDTIKLLPLLKEWDLPHSLAKLEQAPADSAIEPDFTDYTEARLERSAKKLNVWDLLMYDLQQGVSPQLLALLTRRVHLYEHPDNLLHYLSSAYAHRVEQKLPRKHPLRADLLAYMAINHRRNPYTRKSPWHRSWTSRLKELSDHHPGTLGNLAISYQKILLNFEIEDALLLQSQFRQLRQGIEERAGARSAGDFLERLEQYDHLLGFLGGETEKLDFYPFFMEPTAGIFEDDGTFYYSLRADPTEGYRQKGIKYFNDFLSDGSRPGTDAKHRQQEWERYERDALYLAKYEPQRRRGKLDLAQLAKDLKAEPLSVALRYYSTQINLSQRQADGEPEANLRAFLDANLLMVQTMFEKRDVDGYFDDFDDELISFAIHAQHYEDPQYLKAYHQTLIEHFDPSQVSLSTYGNELRQWAQFFWRLDPENRHGLRQELHDLLLPLAERALQSGPYSHNGNDASIDNWQEFARLFYTGPHALKASRRAFYQKSAAGWLSGERFPHKHRKVQGDFLYCYHLALQLHLDGDDESAIAWFERASSFAQKDYGAIDLRDLMRMNYWFCKALTAEGQVDRAKSLADRTLSYLRTALQGQIVHAPSWFTFHGGGSWGDYRGKRSESINVRLEQLLEALDQSER